MINMDPRDDLETQIQRFLLTSVLKPSLVKTSGSRLGQGSLGWGSAGVAVGPCEIGREFGRQTGGGQRGDLIDRTVGENEGYALLELHTRPTRTLRQPHSTWRIHKCQPTRSESERHRDRPG